MLTFQTKAQTLKQLEGVVGKSRVLPQVCFTVRELHENSDEIKRKIAKQFGDRKLIIRSSAVNEDSLACSNAGVYLSVLNIFSEQVIEQAKRVCQSFSDDCPDNQLFVQPMLENVRIHGVWFTVDPNTGGNYHVVNYDTSGSTTSVTSGKCGDFEVHYLFHGRKSRNCQLSCLEEAMEELMEIFDTKALDIEFAVDDTGQIFILQVRPLVLKTPIADYEVQARILKEVEDYIYAHMHPSIYLAGERTIYGGMPDWNPAEIIGIRPKPLALSLYKRLVTNQIWAWQRERYGYKDLRGFPLMTDFCGLPYIDTRISFNSFIPKNLTTTTCSKLVNYYLDKLEKHPEYHDVVEFEIVFTCLSFEIPDKLRILRESGFTEDETEEIKDALRVVTNSIINSQNGFWKQELEEIATLRRRHVEIMMATGMPTIGKIYWLLENIARYGLLPFAGLARCGFVAVSFLKSMVYQNIFTMKEYQAYMRTIRTVSTQLKEDRQANSLEIFLDKWGFLRPSMYDVTSSRYDKAPWVYFDGNSCTGTNVQPQPFILTNAQKIALQDLMTENGLTGDTSDLFMFIKNSIEGREFSKMVFSQCLSDALELLVALGQEYGFTRDDVAYLDCRVLDQLYVSPHNIEAVLLKAIGEGKERYRDTLTFTMPPVIFSPDDLYDFNLPSQTPHFVTLKEVTGEICTETFCGRTVTGKILLIEAADPGYDWIFSYSIAGIITAYGGVNSHMAIRAGEFGIPTVMGVGEKMFRYYKQARVLHIDCSNKIIEVIR